MKKVLLVLVMIVGIFSSCSEEEVLVVDCGCVEVQERLITTRSPYYPFWRTTAWEESGVTNDLEECYTDEEISYMVREVGTRERWYITCSNN